MRAIAQRLAQIPHVEAVTLGGSRATGIEIDGVKVDLIYRDLDDVLQWTQRAEDGFFEIQREIGYVAGIATYVLAGELALCEVLSGELPRPSFPERLRVTAPPLWYRNAAGALHFGEVHARRGDQLAALANISQAALCTAHGRLAADGQWALNEKRLLERAGLHHIQAGLRASDLDTLLTSARATLDLPPWT